MVLGLAMNLRVLLGKFMREEGGQDLAEYCLLTGLLALVAAAILVQASGGMQAIWGTANSSLSGSQGASATSAGITGSS
jgi:Flp pilus assembly pilin Flp